MGRGAAHICFDPGLPGAAPGERYREHFHPGGRREGSTCSARRHLGRDLYRGLTFTEAVAVAWPAGGKCSTPLARYGPLSFGAGRPFTNFGDFFGASSSIQFNHLPAFPLSFPPASA